MAQRGLLGITLFSMFIMYCVFQVCSVFMMVNTDEVRIVAEAAEAVEATEEGGLPAAGETAAWEAAFGTSEFNKHMLPYPFMQAVEADWGHIDRADAKAVFIPTAAKYAALP